MLFTKSSISSPIARELFFSREKKKNKKKVEIANRGNGKTPARQKLRTQHLLHFPNFHPSGNPPSQREKLRLAPSKEKGGGV